MVETVLVSGAIAVDLDVDVDRDYRDAVAAVCCYLGGDIRASQFASLLPAHVVQEEGVEKQIKIIVSNCKQIQLVSKF